MTIQPTLTSGAAHRLAGLLGAAGALRVRIEPGGCMGLRYTVTMEEPGTEESDLLVDPSGLRLLVDADTAPLLDGAVIDFDETGFSVRNPNARGSCACGATFVGPLRG